MQYSLARLEDGDEIQRWPVDFDEIIIGRSDRSTIVLDGSSISRQHVRLWIEDGIVAVEDLGSRNGIKINGVRTRSGGLENGDQMEVGNFLFVLTARDAGVVSVNNGKAPEQAPNPEARAVQKRALQNPDIKLNAALAYAARLQPYLFEIDVLLKHMAKIILSDIPAQRCYILGRAIGKKGLATLYQGNQGGTIDGPALNTTIVDHVYRERKPVIVGDVSAEKTVSDDPQSKTGIIGVPLISNKQSIGVLYVDSGWEPSRFVSANLEDMKAYGLAFGAIVDSAIQIEERQAKARMQGVMQTTSALGKCLYEQVHDIREAAKASDTKSLDRELHRSDQAIQQMIALSNLHHTSRHSININDVIDKALADLKTELQQKALMIRFQHGARALVFGDSHQLLRASYGLLATCIDACSESGTITISTENKTDGCHVNIRTDSSTVSPSQAERLSSNVLDNTGLGMNGVMLAHAYAVIKSHGGTIRAKSDEHSGIQFAALLPQQQTTALSPESLPAT